MSVEAGSLQTPSARGAPWRLGALAAMAAVAVTAALIVLNRPDVAPRSASVDRPAYQTVVTGTGPGLSAIAGAPLSAYQGSVVTGTGPGLAELARGGFGAYQGSVVTGTGPGLAELAGNQGDAQASVGPGPSRLRG
jgi:hypothetical protein